jgi:uncharacterized protein YggE
MWKVRLVSVLAIFCAALVGRANTDVTVTREVSAGSSEAWFTVDATAAATTGVPQAVTALEAVGVRIEHLRSAYYQQGRALPLLGNTEPATVTYSFELRVPAARLEALSLEMDRLFRKPAPPITSFQFSARLVTSSAGLEAARLAVLPSLFEEARAKAEAMLSAAGQTPGPVLALQDAISATYDASATAKLSLRMARLNPAAAAVGQPLGRGVTVGVTRAIAAPFDSAVITLGTEAGVEQSLKLLAPLGVTAANLTSRTVNLLTGNPFFESRLVSFSQFELVKPAEELPRFVDAFNKLMAATAPENGGASFWASLGYSAALIARERDKALPALLAEARRKAEPLARLLTLPLGNPRAIQDDGSALQPAVLVNGNFLGRTAFPQFLLESGPGISMVVEFALE